MKSKTPTLGGGATPPAVPHQPARRVTPPPFKAQTPPPSRPGTPPPLRAQTPPPFKAQTPPPHALDAVKFESEPPTKQKNMTASIYQSLLSVFDEMSDDQRMEFVDITAVYASLTAGARKDLVEILELYAKLGPEDRKAVLELVKNLETTHGL